MEGAIITPDVSKSIPRYQLAIDEAKVRLDFAVAPGTWLMPSRMVLNTESVVGYNNNLTQVTQGMQLGVTDDVNKGTKKGRLHSPSRCLPGAERPLVTDQTPFCGVSGNTPGT